MLKLSGFKNKNKIIFTTLSVLVLAAIGLCLYYVVSHHDSKNSSPIACTRLSDDKAKEIAKLDQDGLRKQSKQLANSCIDEKDYEALNSQQKLNQFNAYSKLAYAVHTDGDKQKAVEYASAAQSSFATMSEETRDQIPDITVNFRNQKIKHGLL